MNGMDNSTRFDWDEYIDAASRVSARHLLDLGSAELIRPWVAAEMERVLKSDE